MMKALQPRVGDHAILVIPGKLAYPAEDDGESTMHLP
jgi:FKBP-type peptidyl-prolyl cis-trans isomerase